MRKFILINSPLSREPIKADENYLPPLGLGYIATYLNEAEINVEVVDCIREKISVSKIISYVNNIHPDFVGINIFTQNYEIVKYIIENIDVGIDCFIGGQAVKSIYDDIISWNTDNILNIIIGEGEFLIPAIVNQCCVQKPMKQSKSRAVYKVDNDSAYFPKDISNIHLNRDFLGNETILNHYDEKEVAIITSRGCPFNCAFCGGANSSNKNISIRIRTEASIKDEIEEILFRYPDIQSIRILDDLFLRNSESVKKANSIFSEFPQLSWRGMVHVLSLTKSLECIKELKIGKCKELFMGIESGSETIRNKINKMGTVNEVIKVSEEILKNGIDLKGYFIYGFPNETEKDFRETYNLAAKIKEISQSTTGKFRTSVFQFRPYHGTQLYDEIIRNGGKIDECKFNSIVSKSNGRSQFSFDSGNYSMESTDLLNQYILKTQGLGDE